eukprot:sb/3468741/
MLYFPPDRLIEILSSVVFEQCLVFSNYQSGAEEIKLALSKDGFSSELISGSMAQKQRSQTMSDFRECKFRILISTDVTARGIDNEHVDLVVNMDLPINTLGTADPHTYLHRAVGPRFTGILGTCPVNREVKEAPPYTHISELLRLSKEEQPTTATVEQAPTTNGHTTEHHTSANNSDYSANNPDTSYSANNLDTNHSANSLDKSSLQEEQIHSINYGEESVVTPTNEKFTSLSGQDIQVLRCNVKVTQKV